MQSLKRNKNSNLCGFWPQAKNTTAYPSLSVHSEKERMNEGRPIYNLTFLPGANRPEVEKLP